MALEELRELAARNRAQAEQIRIKKESSTFKKEKRTRVDVENEENVDDGEVTITGENRSNKRARLSTDSGVEAVDLTDD